MYRKICTSLFWALILAEIFILMIQVYVAAPGKNLKKKIKEKSDHNFKNPMRPRIAVNYNIGNPKNMQYKRSKSSLNLNKRESAFPQRLLMDINSPSSTTKYLTCRDIDRMQIVDIIGKGTTKEVFLGEVDGKEMAVKMVTSHVQDIKTCLNKRGFEMEDECFVLANYKLMKEISLLMQLDHANIVKLLGFCVRGETHSGSLNDHGVISLTQRGAKLNRYKLQKLTWPERWQMVMDVADLIEYCHSSPIGSILLGDFKMSQFVVIDKRIRLADLDDVTNTERPCKKNRDCYVLGERVGVQCTNGTCQGINSRANILMATVELIMPLLENAPPYIANETEDLVRRMSRNQIEVTHLKEEIEIIRKLDENAVG